MTRRNTISSPQKPTSSCPFCGPERDLDSPLWLSSEHAVILCKKCGIHQSHPILKNPSGFYQESYYSRQKSRRFAAILEYGIRWFRWVRASDLHRRYASGRILDVGCGRGLMIHYLQNRLGWDVHGTQISATAHDYATNILKVPVFLGDLLEMPSKEPFSVVTMYHVLEHVVDPAAYLGEINRIMTKGGALVIEVPNTASLMCRIARERWFGWDLPFHTFHFSPDSLPALLTKKGFTVEKIRHWSFEFSVFGVLQSTLNMIFEEQDYLFRLLQKKARIGHSPVRAISCLVLSVVLTPPATLVAIAGAAAGAGEVIRLYCRKKSS